jgi:hypothetical protein
MLLLFNIELAAMVALVAILAWQNPKLLVAVCCAWWLCSGVRRPLVPYTRSRSFVAMIIFSDRDWDTPPGTGYLTVAVITISAILTVIMTLRAPKRRAGDDPPPGHKSELRTLA